MVPSFRYTKSRLLNNQFSQTQIDVNHKQLKQIKTNKGELKSRSLRK